MGATGPVSTRQLPPAPATAAGWPRGGQTSAATQAGPGLPRLVPPLLYHLVAPSFFTFAVAPLLYPSALLPLFLYLLSAFKFGEELDKPFGARLR